MPLYKEPKLFEQSDSTAFDAIHKPGSPTPHSGVYRCVNCGREVVSAHPHPLPPQDHHQHSDRSKPIQWKLVAAPLPV
jgi:hypothetical protein